MAKHRTHSIEFKRQVVLGGESPHALARRHGISRNLIKIWVAKYEAGGLDSDTAAADVLADYEARVGRQAYIAPSRRWAEKLPTGGNYGSRSFALVDTYPDHPSHLALRRPSLNDRAYPIHRA
jgi:transposase